MSPSVTSSPIDRFSRTVSANRKDSWNTRAVGASERVRIELVQRAPTEADLAARRVERGGRAGCTASSCRRRSTRRGRRPRRATRVRSRRRARPRPRRRTARRRARPRAARPGRAVGVAGCARTGAASTPSIRSLATTARGSSSRRNPTMRKGKARMPNSAIACTSSPVVTAPLATRHAPSHSSTIVPRFGRASRPGSKPARSRPTTSRSRRRSSARVAQPLDLALLQAERLHDERALEALVGDRGHVTDARLGRRRRLLDLLRVGVVEDGEAGEERQRDGEEHRVDEGELGHRHDDDHDDPERERQRLHRHRRALAVGVGVGEELAGRVLVEPAERHRRGTGRSPAGTTAPASGAGPSARSSGAAPRRPCAAGTRRRWPPRRGRRRGAPRPPPRRPA